MNKEFTQKDADELLNIELMAKQLIERVQALRAKFIDVEGEIKKKRKATKRQLEKQQFELSLQRMSDKRHERIMKQHLLAGHPAKNLFRAYPEKRAIIERLIEEIINKR